MAVTNSPNMTLPIPTVGTEQGPDYALDVNASLTLVDGHDHSAGRGVQITPDGLNINADLTLQGNSLTNINGLVFTAQASNSTLQTLYVKPGVESPLTEDLWFNDGNGNAVQITSGGLVNATIASIPGESYAAGTFTWVQGAGSVTPANFNIGSIILRPILPATTFGVVLSPPAGISSQYDIAFPLLPSVNSFMAINSSGVMTNTIPVALGITAANIAPQTITTGQISATAGILGTQLANNTVDFAQVALDLFTWQQQDYVAVVATYSVRLASTANLSLTGAATIDGSAVVTSDKILVKNQTIASNNGIYIANTAGSWSRDPNYDTFTELNQAAVIVSTGTISAGRSYYQNNTLTSLSSDQSWSTSQTYLFTVPADVNELVVVAVAGGGGGGSGEAYRGAGNGTMGGGGGAGAQPVYLTLKVTPGDILSCDVGAGGLGGLAPYNGNAANGHAGGPGGFTKISSTAINLYLPGASGGGAGVGVQGGAGAGVGASTYADNNTILGIVAASTGGTAATTGTPNATAGNATIFALTPAVGGTGLGTPNRGTAGGGGGSGMGVGGVGGNAANATANDGAAAPATNYGAGGGGGSGTLNSGTAGGTGGVGATGLIRISRLGTP
jgi:hypothetical protein